MPHYPLTREIRFSGPFFARSGKSVRARYGHRSACRDPGKMPSGHPAPPTPHSGCPSTQALVTSGLLIRAACIQFFCAAPILTCGYAISGLSFCARFVPVLAPCSLACFRPAGRGCQFWSIGLSQHGSAPAPTLRNVRGAGSRLDGPPHCSSAASDGSMWAIWLVPALESAGASRPSASCPSTRRS